MDTPQTSQDFLWWGFNAAWLIVIGLAGAYVSLYLKGIRDEIRGMRGEIRTEQRYSKWIINVMNMMRTRCQMLHPEHPMPDMPPPPEEEPLGD